MANQSLVAVPPNVEEPVVLQRFLSRLVEQLDVVLGNRSGPNEQYVSQQDLLNSAEELTKLLQTAQDALERALLRLDDVDELIVEELTKRIIAVEEKNVEQDNRLSVIENFAVLKGVMLQFTVDGGGAPDILINFNINAGTASRISTGLYEFSLVQTTFNGFDVIDNSITTLSWVVAVTATSELFQVEFMTTGTAGTFRVQVKEFVVGGGSKLEINPYDLQVNDKVDISALINIPSSVLPPSY